MKKKHPLRSLTLLALSLALGGVLLEWGLVQVYEFKTRHLIGQERFVPRQTRQGESPYLFTYAPDVPVILHGIERPVSNLATLGPGPVDADPPSGVRRILIYGDSLTFGYKVALEQTYAHLLEQRLLGQGQPVQILNMARGQSPGVYQFHLREDVPRLRPALVIVQIEVVNDHSDEAFVQVAGAGDGGGGPDGDAQPEGSGQADIPARLLSARYLIHLSGAHQLSNLPLSHFGLPGSPSLLEQTVFYTALSRLATGSLMGDALPYPAFPDGAPHPVYRVGFDRELLTHDRLETAFERMFDFVAGMHHYLASRQIDFLVLAIPPRYVFDAAPGEPDASPPPADEPSFREGGRRLHFQAIEALRRRGIPFVDMARPFAQGGGERLYFDFCHFRPEGHRIVARTLSQRLAPGGAAGE